MERRYSLDKVLRLAVILAAISAVCFLFSCKNSGQGSGEEIPAPQIEETPDSGLTPGISETPESPQDSSPEPTTPEPEDDQAPTGESGEPEAPDSPDVSGSPDVSEPPETWNTPNSPKGGQMPGIPETPGDDDGSGEGDANRPERVYPTPDKIAYITIDDGPTRAITPQLLDILKEEGVNATFFVLPHSDVDDIYVQILDEGHVIGNHSYSHKYKLLYANDTAFFLEDLMMMHDFLFDMLGYTSTLYRFPGGAMGRNKATIAARVEILAEYGYTHFDWNSSAGDADATGEGKDAQVLIDNVLNKTNGRQQLIVLMHDSLGKQTTVDALPYIIDGLRMQGYAFDTLDNYG